MSLCFALIISATEWKPPSARSLSSFSTSAFEARRTKRTHGGAAGSLSVRMVGMYVLICAHASLRLLLQGAIGGDVMRTETVRVRVCKCGHEEDTHSPTGCFYGHGTAMGGCDCPKFRSRGRVGVRAVLVPPVTTIDTILREMVRAEVTRQLGPHGVLRSIPGTQVTHIALPKALVDLAHEVNPNGRRSSNGSVVLQGIDRKLLQALAMHGPSSEKRLALLAGYSRSGSFSAALTRLRKGGYIHKTGAGNEITSIGRPLVSGWTPLPTGQALMDFWSTRLGPCGTSILEVLVRAYPNEVRTPDLAEATRYKTSGTFSATQTKLRALGLMDGHRASREFVEAVRGGAS